MCPSMWQQLTLERCEVTGGRQHFAQVHYDCECLTRHDVCLAFSYRDLRSGDAGYFKASVLMGSHPDRSIAACKCMLFHRLVVFYVFVLCFRVVTFQVLDAHAVFLIVLVRLVYDSNLKS